jgi:hypothetical protein
MYVDFMEKVCFSKVFHGIIFSKHRFFFAFPSRDLELSIYQLLGYKIFWSTVFVIQ